MSKATNIIAIDGPVGTGKSSVARAVAKALGFAFLDTGAMYRAATWWALHKGVDLDDVPALIASTQSLDLEMRDLPEGLKVYAGGHDISEAIRTTEVTRLIYKLDQIPEVRAQLVKLQQEFGEKQATVAEGRDIGTVVFPNAACKIYMDADLDVRTKRRAEQMMRGGAKVDEAALRVEIAERDAGSMLRAHSPLRQAEDAIYLDTSGMAQDEVVNAIVKLAKERLCSIPR